MSDNLLFFQSTEIGGNPAKLGLVDLLITHIKGDQSSNLFTRQQIVVPNQAMATWLKDLIATRDGICANLDCVVLLGPVLQNIYLANNPQAVLYDFNQAKYLIYELLCSQKIECDDSTELNNYIYDADGELNKLRTYQLASQLQQIFHEYLYLRTTELLNLKSARFKNWQKIIWQHLEAKIGEQATFLDVYSYFAKLDLNSIDIKLPEKLFIFGLTSVYPSQLEIVQKLASKVTIYWYYQPCSYEYYGDLLSNKARAKLEQRLLRKPDLSLDDLYLLDGNPLLANLGQQSREFIELLQASDIEVYNFNTNSNQELPQAATMLEIIQHDIRNLSYRLRPEYRLGSNDKFYTNPLQLCASDSPAIYDLMGNQLSLKVNVCHNAMREVQVMFNELAHILNNNPDTSLGDILVTAPDIDDYAPYIKAVFDNELVQRADGEQVRLGYSLTGNRRHKNYKILETLQLILNAPYHLPVSYLLEILAQNEIQLNLEISANDIDLIKSWLKANAVHFGYDATDYAELGYHDYPVHSFKQFLNNLVLGACLNQTIMSSGDRLPLYHSAAGDYVPYDNLDNAQIKLVNKLIKLISLLENLKAKFYLDALSYREFSFAELHEILTNLQTELVSDDDSFSISNDFLSSIGTQNSELTLNLAIANLLFSEYVSDFKSKLTFSGKITCASLQYMRNLSFKHIYVLGMNFGEFPRAFRPNQLSLLAYDWSLADRNYTNEDKQVFLDTILGAKQQIIFSYIGRKETDNSTIKPSPLLGLFLDTLGQSFSDFWVGNDLTEQKFDYKNVVQQHSLHPFYHNSQLNYSGLWQQLSAVSANQYTDLRWDFTKISPLKLTAQQEQKYYQLDTKSLLNTFSYTNNNLFQILGLNNYNQEIELSDNESFELTERYLANSIYQAFEAYPNAAQHELVNYLQLKGVLGYQHIGEWQFAYYRNLYQHYKAQQPSAVEISLNYRLERNQNVFELNFKDKVLFTDGYIIVMDAFASIGGKSLASKLNDVPYALRMRGLIYAALSAANLLINGETVNIEGVIIRQLNASGEYHDFKISLENPEEVLSTLMSYYIRSLTNPVLVHRGAINEYARALTEIYYGKLRNTPEQAKTKAEAKYSASFNNYELDQIRKDPIFAAIADNYFGFMRECNGVNDIVQIGKLLANLKG